MGGGGALQAHTGHGDCHGFPSRLHNQAWSQIYSLSASCDEIPWSYHQIVKNPLGNFRLASKNCKDSFTRKLTLQILFNFEQYFLQVHLLGFHLMEAYLGMDKSP